MRCRVLIKIDKWRLLTGLIPYANYSIQIATVNEHGVVGIYSYSIMIQTPGDGLLRVSLLIQSLCITVLSSVSGVLVSTSLSQLLDSSTEAKWSHHSL